MCSSILSIDYLVPVILKAVLVCIINYIKRSYQSFIFIGKLAVSTREYDTILIADPENAML